MSLQSRFVEIAGAPFATVAAIAVGLGVALDNTVDQYGDNPPEILKDFLADIAAQTEAVIELALGS